MMSTNRSRVQTARSVKKPQPARSRVATNSQTTGARRKRGHSSPSSSDDDAEEKEATKESLPCHSLTPADDPAPTETNPTKIKQPISSLVHECLTSAWVINPKSKLHYLFDVVSPVRQFKRGMPYVEEGQFPEYSPETAGDITETDGGPDGLMPYMPREYLYVACAFSLICRSLTM